MVGHSMLVSLFCFLRFNELIRIRPVDITFNEGWISIKIHKSKMDQLRKREEVMVARMGFNLCPVAEC